MFDCSLGNVANADNNNAGFHCIADDVHDFQSDRLSPPFKVELYANGLSLEVSPGCNYYTIFETNDQSSTLDKSCNNT